MNKLWVVEMWTGRRWEPTVGVALRKKASFSTLVPEGEDVLRDWRKRNPDTKFRLRAYVERVEK